MSSAVVKVLLGVALIGSALGVSAFVYSRSRSADFDRHAEAVAAIGRLRHRDEHLAELVLAVRFGLLNQYDSLTDAAERLGEAPLEVRRRITDVVTPDRELDRALAAVEDAVHRQRQRVERFEAENAVLKNSLHYLPTAANEASLALRGTTRDDEASISVLIPRLVQAVLVHDLIGDQSTRNACKEALQELEAKLGAAPPSARQEVATLISHARVVSEKEDAVDGWVKQVFDSGDGDRISAAERLYQAQFARTVASSNRYRRILYGWSLLLLAAVSAAGLELRRMYANLERLVAQRTAELSRALEALWGEMKLASKIQQALVPTSPELTGYDVAAAMRAVDSVGGDYYDVVRARDADWVLIGDVSGHGVPAGLVMMMCHTAVRTLLRSDPGIMPDRLLAGVNGVLTETIRQLGEDKYMTISALRHERDGTVRFAGAHQDLHILRAETSAVETIETSGPWIGLKPEIGDAMVTREFHLAEGDVLVLHTDGVTEATASGQMFDVGGLRRVLAEDPRRGSAEVLSAIFDALAGYAVTDDATVLAIRRMPAVTDL